MSQQDLASRKCREFQAQQATRGASTAQSYQGSLPETDKEEALACS